MATLIRYYGVFWNPDTVDWGSRGRGKKMKLIGDVIRDKHTYEEVNFSKARGIYVLYDNFKPIYVGKSFEGGVGSRLRSHLTDRFAGRWDMFSWYTTSNFNKGTRNIRHAGGKHIDPKVVVSTLEALAILIADPALNRKRESLPDALEVIQSDSDHPATIRSYLQRILLQVQGGKMP